MISVIGAGPAGSYAAYLLAKQGYEVKLFEEHAKVGAPIQCTGILTEGIDQFWKPKKETVTNIIRNITVHSEKESVTLQLKKREYIVNRTAFDQSIAEKAQDAGATIHTSSRFVGKKEDQIEIKDVQAQKTKTYSPTHIIGADGPNSQVGKSIGSVKPTFFYGAQATIKGNFDPSTYEVYLGKVCPDVFAWVVPEDEHHARAGLATFAHPHKYFQAFLKKLGSPKICECQGGIIPLYNPKKETEKQTSKQSTFLIGDAAGQVKATTLGGIIQGMTAAKAAATAITTQQSYEKLWKAALGKDLYAHLLIHKMMHRFSDKDYDFLVRLVKQQRVKHILETYERDYPTKFLAALAWKEPRFAYFLRFLIG